MSVKRAGLKDLGVRSGMVMLIRFVLGAGASLVTDNLQLTLRARKCLGHVDQHICELFRIDAFEHSTAEDFALLPVVRNLHHIECRELAILIITRLDNATAVSGTVRLFLLLLRHQHLLFPGVIFIHSGTPSSLCDTHPTDAASSCFSPW